MVPAAEQQNVEQFGLVDLGREQSSSRSETEIVEWLWSASAARTTRRSRGEAQHRSLALPWVREVICSCVRPTRLAKKSMWTPTRIRNGTRRGAVDEDLAVAHGETDRGSARTPNPAWLWSSLGFGERAEQRDRGTPGGIIGPSASAASGSNGAAGGVMRTMDPPVSETEIPSCTPTFLNPKFPGDRVTPPTPTPGHPVRGSTTGRPVTAAMDLLAGDGHCGSCGSSATNQCARLTSKTAATTCHRTSFTNDSERFRRRDWSPDTTKAGLPSRHWLRNYVAPSPP